MRNVGACVVAALLGAASFVIAEDPKPAPKARALTDQESKILDKVNSYRKAAGLSAVSVDFELCDGCQKHAQYLVTNYLQQKSEGKSGIDEVEGRTGFTKEGQKAGLASEVHYVEPMQAIDEWMATVFNRAAFLQPNLEKIGIGVARGGSNPPFYVVIDTKSGITGDAKAPYCVYPTDKQAGVPLLYKMEGRNAIPDDKDGKAGFPVTVVFKHRSSVTAVKATLKDARGQEVATSVLTPENSAPAKDLRIIAIIAQDPLERSTTYTASFEAEVNGEKVTKTWTFTTGKK